MNKLTAAVGATVTLLAVEPALAQLEEVVVTASRRAESVQDIPYNITATTGESLKGLGVEDASDLIRVIPGLSAVDTGARNRNVLAIRGLNASGLDANDGPGAISTVSTYIDETPLNIDLRILDLNRVEVLRGPQGTLFGAGAMGGVVRYMLNRPDFESFTGDLHGRVSTTEESDDLSYDTDLTLNIPLSDNLAVRAVGGLVDKSGFIDYVNVEGSYDSVTGSKKKDANDEEVTSLRLALRWMPTDSLDMTASYFYQDQEVGARQVASRDFTGDKYATGLQHVEPKERTDELFTLNISWDIGFAELVSATSYSEYEDDGSRDQTGLLINLDYGYEDFPEFRAFTRDQIDQDSFTQELRLVSTSESKLSWIVGAFYTEYDFQEDSIEITPGFGEYIGADRTDDLEFVSLKTDESEEIAFYGELSYAFTERWQATIGARYFELEQDVMTCQAFPLFDNTPEGEVDLGCRVGADDDISDTFFKFNTSFYATEDIMLYFTASEGFRRGGVNAVPIGGQVDVLPNERSYDPDTVTNYELGMRSTLLDGMMTFNAALFSIDWEDIQLKSITESGSIPITVNASEAKSQGIEMELQAALSDSLTLSLGYAYNNAELTEDALGLGEDGDRLPGVPEHQGNIAADYLQPFSFGDVNFHLDASYTSDLTSQLNESNVLYRELDGYTIINGSISLELENWRLTAFGDNLANEYAETGLRNYERPEAAVGEFHYIIRPRTFGVDVQYSF
jgi:outer membrane receptor protein involved in Fe transport